MKNLRLLFTKPYCLELESRAVGSLKAGELLVKTHYSAISHGTELLVYSGKFPDTIPLDSTFGDARNPFRYPLSYGYSVVGEVLEKGSPENNFRVGDRVFAFKNHQSHFKAGSDELIPIPEGIDFKDALFFPNMETAVNLLMDGKPMIGERVAVLGQGTVGLLVSALVSRFPQIHTLALDLYRTRLAKAGQLGVKEACCLSQTGEIAENYKHSFDLSFEVTGNPAALDLAITLSRPGARIIIGSFYGKKRSPVNLGDTFHRNRISIYSSQVSSIAPQHSLCWDKKRRSQIVWQAIREIKPGALISHCFDFERAADAYRQIQNEPELLTQVIFKYAKE